MAREPKKITCIVDAAEPEPDLQCRAAAIAQAHAEDLVLVDPPKRRHMRHQGRTFLEVTWETVPAPPSRDEGFLLLP